MRKMTGPPRDGFDDTTVALPTGRSREPLSPAITIVIPLTAQTAIMTA